MKRSDVTVSTSKSQRIRIVDRNKFSKRWKFNQYERNGRMSPYQLTNHNVQSKACIGTDIFNRAASFSRQYRLVILFHRLRTYSTHGSRINRAFMDPIEATWPYDLRVRCLYARTSIVENGQEIDTLSDRRLPDPLSAIYLQNGCSPFVKDRGWHACRERPTPRHDGWIRFRKWDSGVSKYSRLLRVRWIIHVTSSFFPLPFDRLPCQTSDSSFLRLRCRFHLTRDRKLVRQWNSCHGR